MKKVILDLRNITDEARFNSFVQAGFNMGFTDFMISKAFYQKLEKVERVKIWSFESLGDKSQIVFPIDKKTDLEKAITENKNSGLYIEIKDKAAEQEAIRFAEKGADFIIAKAGDWKVIPFENLIAALSKLDAMLIADVEDKLEDAELLFKTLEKGVDGVLFMPKSESEITEIKKLIGTKLSIELVPAEILKITEIPDADRVCVDTSSMLLPGEGMLVGSTALGFTLVHAEIFETEFVASRPFRVNASDVSAYLLGPEFKTDGSIGTRTKYLSELKAGDRVLIVGADGHTRIVSVGRVKIETRPMLLFELKTKTETPVLIKSIHQNAETIRLVRAEGKPASVVDLKPGDAILVHIGPGATHFGTSIKETILEK